MLFESNFKDEIEVSYIYKIDTHSELNLRVQNADIIYCSRMSTEILKKYNLPKEKTWCVGTKNFGKNNGYFYNYNEVDYCVQRTIIDQNFIMSNKTLKSQWGNRYVDLINILLDDNNTVPVFTDNCMYISQDCRHLTKYGAVYLSYLINQKSHYIFEFIKKQNETNHTRP